MKQIEKAKKVRAVMAVFVHPHEEAVARAPMLAWRAGGHVYIEADANGRGGGWGIITKVARRWATVEVGGKASLFDMVRRTKKGGGGAGLMLTPEERYARLHSDLTHVPASTTIQDRGSEEGRNDDTY